MVTTEISKTKLVVKVHEPLIAIINHRIDAACLKRDSYLDKALRVEAEFLRKEIATPNSDKAKNYIAAQLGNLQLKPLNLLLSTKTVDLINEVCKEKNVPRDSFFNRFFLLLIASDTLLFTLFEQLFAWALWGYSHEYGLDELQALLEDIEAQDGFGQYFQLHFEEIATAFYIVRQRNNNFKNILNRPSVLDSIEDSILNHFTRLRMVTWSLIVDTEKWKEGYSGTEWKEYLESCPLPIEIYLYPFKKNALQRLPAEYDFLKANNALGFNTFMSDEQIAELETLDVSLNEEMSKKSNQDKLLAAMLKEKQLRAEKEKSTGDAK